MTGCHAKKQHSPSAWAFGGPAPGSVHLRMASQGNSITCSMLFNSITGVEHPYTCAFSHSKEKDIEMVQVLYKTGSKRSFGIFGTIWTVTISSIEAKRHSGMITSCRFWTAKFMISFFRFSTCFVPCERSANAAAVQGSAGSAGSQTQLQRPWGCPRHRCEASCASSRAGPPEVFRSNAEQRGVEINFAISHRISSE